MEAFDAFNRLFSLAGVWSEDSYTDVCSRMLTYAHVCSRMLTYAHITDVCGRNLTYADVC